MLFAVGGVVEFDGVVVVGEDDAGGWVWRGGEGGGGVEFELEVAAGGKLAVGTELEFELALGGGEEDVAVAAGVDVHIFEHGVECFVQGRQEEVAARAEISEAVDDENAVCAEQASHFGKGLTSHQMGRGGIAQERVENNSVVVFLRFVDVKTAVTNVDVRGGGIEVEVSFGERNDGGIDFDDIDADAFAGEFAGDDADAHADAEGVLEVGGVAPGEFVEHVGEEGEADFGLRIVGVLDEEIVEVIAAVGGFVVEDLEFAEVGIAAVEAGHVVKLVSQAIVDGPRACESKGSEENDCEADSPRRGAIGNQVNARKQQEHAGGDEHCGGVWQEWEEDVADENGSLHTAEGADGGEASDLAADDLDRLSQHANDERAGGGEERQRHEKQKQGGEEGAFGEIQIQAGVSNFFTRDNAEGEVNGGGGDAIIQTVQGRGTIDEPAAEVISQSERDQCDCDLCSPNEMRRANVRR